MIHVQDREMVLPGQLLAADIPYDANCFKDGRNIYSLVRGLVRVDKNNVSVIPAKGNYIPQNEDVVIGVVVDVMAGIWIVDIKAPYTYVMRGEEATRNPLREDLSRYYKIGDVISAKVGEVNEIKDAALTRPWKLEGGRLIEVNAGRVPRIIGKKRSMLNMLKEKTQCKIVVGQNGLIWVDGAKSDLAVAAIKKIELEAQTQGLTDRIAHMLDEELKNLDSKKM